MRRRAIIVVLLALVCCLIIGRQTMRADKEARISFFAMDTYMSINAYGKKADNVLDDVRELICEKEAAWSVTLPDSEVSLLNESSFTELSCETAALLKEALDIAIATNGAFDPTVYPLVKAWGITTDSPRVPEESEIQNLLTKVGCANADISGNFCRLSNGAQLDFGGIAKGYAGELAAEYLIKHGIKSALLNLGGNIQLVGAKCDGTDWVIGVQSPENDGLLGTLKLRDTAVITSGAYERSFTAPDGTVYGHIISPYTGYPADSDILSATVVCKSGAKGDGFSTAIFVLGSEKAIELWQESKDFEMLLYTKNKSLLITEKLAENFEIEFNSDVSEIKILK